MNQKTIVYIDESGFAYDMPRRYGYARVGERCVGKHNWHEKGRSNVIGALVDSRLITVSVFNGTINAAVFLAWLEQDLLPILPLACVIVMDNAAFHNRANIQQLINNSGHILEYLPPYSPDLNPIEPKWAQSKTIRRQKHCSVDELFAYHVS